MNTSLRWLVTASLINLFGNSLGTIVALQQNLAAELGSVSSSQSVLQDFVGFKGAALSAPLSFLLIELVLVLLALPTSRLGRVGMGGLTFVGLFLTVAQAGEPILLRQFSPAGFHFLQFVVLLINIGSSLAMLISGVQAWRMRRAPQQVMG